uniref:NTF2 domain-containing protein n=1 Tax=Heterorhabditis bacteriophora TaxID=37862 RepID=A0A1I7WMY6_HETBA
MNSVNYQQVLENQLLSYYNAFPQKNFIFQQDNAAITRADLAIIKHLSTNMTGCIFLVISKFSSSTDY